MQVVLLKPIEEDFPKLLYGLARHTQVAKAFSDDISMSTALELTRKLYQMGHYSIFEFITFTAELQGISRIALAQLTRHRHCSFISHSQQYTKQSKVEFYPLPQTSELAADYEACCIESKLLYEDLECYYGRDLARYCLPGGSLLNLIIHTNLRELLTVLIPQRLCKRNTPEVSEIVNQLVKELASHAPALRHFLTLTGPECLTSNCKQLNFTCGKPLERNWYI